ncbi:MAG TPA: DHA2 family efflux MFS transporter permease subunit [Gammaproteobacteria bacterium]|jgi:DHA2 family lincomycin resistance protein-like MFS transporter
MSTVTLEAGGDLAARNRLVINLLLVSSFVVILNETMMAVATPALMQSLGVTAAAAQWLTTAFLLTMAVGIPMTGFLLQRLHTRTVFILAMALFSLGTLAATIAPGLAPLIGARVIQASGTAIMMPLLMTTIMTLVPPDSRGKTMGFVSAVISVAPAIGPVLSGAILNYLHWRWMFVLVLPIALFSLWLGWRRIENVTTPRAAPLDIVSVILSAFAFGGSVYGISLLGVPPGPGNPPPWIPLVIGGAAMVVFVWRQLVLQRTDAALLDLRVFRSRMFTISLTVFALLMLTLFGTIILLPIYLQNVLGLSTLQTGLLLLPGALLMGRLGPTVGRAYDRIGAAKLVIPGVIVVTAVLWAMTLLGTQSHWQYILAGHIVMCVGFALLFTPLFTVCMSSVPPQLYSHGSAVLGSFQQVGGAAGVALFIAIMTAQTAELSASGTTALEALAGGIRAAFLVGAVGALFAVASTFFVRKPAVAPAPVAH